MAIATVQDMSDRVGRTLYPEEQPKAAAYLEDAEARILARVPDALTRADADPVFRSNLVSVECAVAIRAARIGEGVEAAPPADGSISYNPQSQAGYVAVRRSEWRQLGVQVGAFHWSGR